MMTFCDLRPFMKPSQNAATFAALQFVLYKLFFTKSLPQDRRNNKRMALFLFLLSIVMIMQVFSVVDCVCIILARLVVRLIARPAYDHVLPFTLSKLLVVSFSLVVEVFFFKLFYPGRALPLIGDTLSFIGDYLKTL